MSMYRIYWGGGSMLNICNGMHNIIFPLINSRCKGWAYAAKKLRVPLPLEFSSRQCHYNDIGLWNILNILDPSVENLLFTIASAMVIYVSTLPWIPACFWNWKVVKRTTPLSRNPNSPLEQIRIFLAWRNQTPHRSVLPALPSICVYFKNVSKSQKCVIIVAVENAKLKLLKVLSIYNNALCNSSKLFFTTINPGDMGPLDILRKVCRYSQI